MTPRHAVMLALLSAVWGASYLLIAEAIEEIPESLVVLGRTGLAASWPTSAGGPATPSCSAPSRSRSPSC